MSDPSFLSEVKKPLKVLPSPPPPQRYQRQRRGRSQASRSSCHPLKLGLPQFFLPLHLLHLFPRALYLTRRLMVARSQVCLAWWSQRMARLWVSPARTQTRQPVRRWNQLKREQWRETISNHITDVSYTWRALIYCCCRKQFQSLSVASSDICCYSIKQTNVFTSSSLSLAWMTHMASMVVHKCVTQAVARCIDPRGHLNEINWEVMSERLLSGEDMKMLWYYIKKEVCVCVCVSALYHQNSRTCSVSPFSSLTSLSFLFPPSSFSLLPFLLLPSSPPLLSSPLLFLLLSSLPFVLFSIQTILHCQRLRPCCCPMPDWLWTSLCEKTSS